MILKAGPKYWLHLAYHASSEYKTHVTISIMSSQSPSADSSSANNPKSNLERILSRVGRSAVLEDNYIPEVEESAVTSSDEDSSDQETPQPRPVRDGQSYFLPSTEMAFLGNYIIELPDNPYGSCNREQADRIHHHYQVEYQKLCKRFDEEDRVGGEEPLEMPNEELEQEEMEIATGRMVAKWKERGWDRQLRVLESYDNEADPNNKLSAKQWDSLLEWVYQALLPENILALQEVFLSARGAKPKQPNWLQRPTTEAQIDPSQLICLQHIFELNSLETKGRLSQLMRRICCLDIFIAQREQVKIVAESSPPNKRARSAKSEKTQNTQIQKKVNDELLRLYQEQTRSTTTTKRTLQEWLKDGKRWNCFFEDDYLRACPLALICLLPTDGKMTFSQKYTQHVWDFFVDNLHHLCPRLMDMARSLESSIKSFRISGQIEKPFQYWELMPAVDFHSVNGYKRYLEFEQDMTVEEGITLIPQFGRKGADFKRYQSLVSNERNRIQSVSPNEETELAGSSQFSIAPRRKQPPRAGIAPIRASQRLKTHRKPTILPNPNEPAPTSSRGFALEVRRPVLETETVEEEPMLLDDVDVQDSWMSDTGGATPAYRPDSGSTNVTDLEMIPSSVVDLDRDMVDVNMPDFLVDDLRRGQDIQVPCSDVGENDSPAADENASDSVVEENAPRDTDWDSDYLFPITDSDMEKNF